MAEQQEKPTKVKSNEWYTPERYIEAARRVLACIDLDPASCETANETVKAIRYFTKEEDGLAQAWSGRVWLNPPYSLEGSPRGMFSPRESVINRWIQRLIAEFRGGHVSEAILLAKADPKERWFQQLWDFPICFVWPSILFNRPGDLRPEKHQFGNIFVYLGADVESFISEFSAFGTIACRVSSGENV